MKCLGMAIVLCVAWATAQSTPVSNDDIPVIRLNAAGNVANADFLLENVPWELDDKTLWRETVAFLPQRYAQSYICIDKLDEGIIEDAKYWGRVKVTQSSINGRRPVCFISRIPGTSKTFK